VLWIQSVYVLPEWRRRGIYKKLYEHLKRQVEQSPDLRGLRLYVDQRNTAAQEVYERLGMTKEHYQLYEWLKG
jgi:ribosomal protein S18 acetylase RimI-like enzyme